MTDREIKENAIDYIKCNYKKHNNKKELADMLGVRYGWLLEKACDLGVTRKALNKKGDTNRTCTVCKKVFPKTSDFFESYVTTREGKTTFETKCKPCRKNYIQERDSNPISTIQSILRCIKYSEKRMAKGYDIDIGYVHDLLVKQEFKCKITGIPLTFTKGKGGLPSNMSIDRIDSSKGYLRDNIQIVCIWANYAKSDLDLSDFKDMIVKSYNNMENY